MKEMMKEMEQMTQENGKRQDDRKENLRAHSVSLNQNVAQPTSTGHYNGFQFSSIMQPKLCDNIFGGKKSYLLLRSF